MNKIITIPVAIVSVLVFLFLGRFLSPEDNWICVEGQWVKHGNPVAEKPMQDCPDKANFANIVIESPEADQLVGKNLVLKGKARVFENQFNWAILDAVTNKEILAGTGYANAEDMGLYGPFEINVGLNDSISEKIIVQVFDYSAKDGSQQDLVQIPLNFDKDLKDYYEVYFSNNKLDPEISCLKTFPVIKPAGNEEISLRKNIELLLAGPDDSDKENGYFTNIPNNVKINKIEMRDNHTRIDFSKDLAREVAGSCRVTAIRAQIVKTVLAFDKSIRSVIISVGGKTETALQP